MLHIIDEADKRGVHSADAATTRTDTLLAMLIERLDGLTEVIRSAQSNSLQRIAKSLKDQKDREAQVLAEIRQMTGPPSGS